MSETYLDRQFLEQLGEKKKKEDPENTKKTDPEPKAPEDLETQRWLRQKKEAQKQKEIKNLKEENENLEKLVEKLVESNQNLEKLVEGLQREVKALRDALRDAPEKSKLRLN